jgi:hypothetical protein
MKTPLLPLWQRLAELFVAFFFLTSAYLKATESFFGLHSVPLSTAWNYWMGRGWTLSWYKPVLQFFLPYEQGIAVLVILAHGLFGLSLLFQVYRKPAALLFLFIQINLLFATFFGWGFLVMVFASLWMGVYYCTSTPVREKYWPCFTAGIIIFQALLIIGRIQHNDFLLSSFTSQYEHFHREVMSAHIVIKQCIAWCVQGKFGALLWILPFYLHLVFFGLLFTRLRLFAAEIILMLLTLRALIWTNVMGAEAVVHVLLWYIWITEELLQASSQSQRTTLRSCYASLSQKLKMYYCTSTLVQRYFSTPKPSNYYPIFFCAMSILITITLIIPAPFGLQNYNQWGGMYDEHWCQIDASSRDPHDQSSSIPLQSATEYAGFTNTRRVYSGPMNNERTCFEWAKSRCGKQSNSKFSIQFIIVSLKGRKFLNEQNICTMIDPNAFPWFGRA